MSHKDMLRTEILSFRVGFIATWEAVSTNKTLLLVQIYNSEVAVFRFAWQG